jgi:hypothetical protein
MTGVERIREKKGGKESVPGNKPSHQQPYTPPHMKDYITTLIVTLWKKDFDRQVHRIHHLNDTNTPDSNTPAHV